MPGQGRLGDKAKAPVDMHSCPGCPHTGIGPAIQGSPDVNVNLRPALRVDDPGIHAACCGDNTWTAVKGSTTVFINGKPAHRMGDETRHCGGMGTLVEGSSNVIVGDSGGAGAGSGPPRRGENTVICTPPPLPAPVSVPSQPAPPAPIPVPAPLAVAVAPEPTQEPRPVLPLLPVAEAPAPLAITTGDLIVSVTTASVAVPGASVTISGAITLQARADGSGVVTFSDIPAGDYQITAAAAGYSSGTSSAIAVAGETTTAPVTLTRMLTITSQTVETAPPDRARRRIGVGEEVQLTASTSASWSVNGGGTLSRTTGDTVVFRAGDRAATATITAIADGASGSIDLEILEPTFRMEIAFGIKHTHGRPDCGFLTRMYLLPADVSFVHVEVRELNSACTATGFYASLNGITHQPREMKCTKAFVVQPPGPDGKGSSAALFDQVYSGDLGGPFANGQMSFPITWEFRVRGGEFRAMSQQIQGHIVDAEGNCTTSKAGATARRSPSAPTSDWLPTR